MHARDLIHQIDACCYGDMLPQLTVAFVLMAYCIAFTFKEAAEIRIDLLQVLSGTDVVCYSLS